MIVNVRGTSGSGKSTLVKRIGELYGRARAVYKPGRKRPLMYLVARAGTAPILSVPGHYETACGGCDTITDQDELFGIVATEARAGRHVMFEGLLVSAEFNRTMALQREFGDQLTVVELVVDLRTCIDGVQARRTARGDLRVLNPKNTENKHRGTRRTCERLREAGVRVVTCATREEAHYAMCKALGLSLDEAMGRTKA